MLTEPSWLLREGIFVFLILIICRFDPICLPSDEMVIIAWSVVYYRLHSGDCSLFGTLDGRKHYSYACAYCYRGNRYGHAK